MRRQIVIYGCMVLAVTCFCAAATATWTGAVSSDLFDSNNWNPAIDLLDDAGDVLTIGAGDPHHPVSNGTLPTRPNGFNTTAQAYFTVTGGDLLPYGNNTLNGDVIVKNGWLNMRGTVAIGSGARGTVTVDGGTFESKYTMYIGRNSGGQGRLEVLEGIVYFPSRPSIGTNGGTGHIYIEEGGFCYIGGDDTSWFQGLADSGVITTAADSAVVIDYQAALNRTRITAEKRTGASLPIPWDGTADTNITALSWKPGTRAVVSYVYLGTDYSAVEDATSNDPEYLGVTGGHSMSIPFALTAGATYYWRVDTSAAWGGVKGRTWSFTPVTTLKPRLMENLDRGLIAVRSGSYNYIGWRLLGTDPTDIGFNVYRGMTKLNNVPISGSTNYLDTGGTIADSYHIRPVIDGVEQGPSRTAAVQTNPYYSIPLARVPGDTDWSYEANDAAVGDLDGDGAYEIVIKRYSADPDEYPVVDAYRMDGTLLWRINLGPNHLSMVQINPIVYDFDSDGFAEVALRTCEGMTDGTGVTVGDTNNDGITDYRGFGNPGDGFIDAGPEFLSIFDGLTGAEMARTDYIRRAALKQWGDTYGHRANKFHMVAAYLDGHRPSLVICRGIYGLTKLEGWNYRDGELTKLWHFTSEEWPGYDSQGNHNLSVGDVDGDGKDEIVYGGMCVDHDGSGLYTTGLGHGDAIHVSDLDPDRTGLEVWRCVETTATGAAFTDAANGDIIFEYDNARDVGRACAGDIDPRYPGAEVWGSTNCPLYTSRGQAIGTSSLSMNFMVWWDGDLLRETLDHAGSQGAWYGKIGKWDYLAGQENTLLAAAGTLSNNWTKGNPCLSGDILGDWREEVIWRADDNRSLRIYTTTSITGHRLYTLIHDPQYRLAIAWQCCGYNQPPHPGFFVGAGMNTPPVPYIEPVTIDADETDPPQPDPMGWAVRPYVSGSQSIAMQAAAAVDPSGVEYYFTCTDGGGHDSGWQSSRFYEDTGLAEGVVYTYTVTARDQSDNHNTTRASIPAACEMKPVTGRVYWDFEDGTAATAFSAMPGGGSVDAISGIVMHGWDAAAGPSFSTETATGTGLSAYCSGSQDGYTTAAALNAWSPQTWTIEVSVRLNDVSGWKSFIGRDGASGGAAESDFYLQRNDVNGAFRVNYLTVGGARHILDGDFAVSAGQWYRLAVTSDGQQLTLYCDKLDGDGYRVVGTLDISGQTPAQNALTQGGFNWTFGRGWYGGSFTDHIDGYIDNIRFSDRARLPAEFLNAPPAPIPWLYGDFTGNHFVNYDDLAVFEKMWLHSDCRALGDFDLDGDCAVTLTELLALANNWLTGE